MATLKVKQIKTNEYFYWCKRVRSRKKFGGDGRVRSVDLLIGTNPVGRWFPYYVYVGEVELQKYAEAILKWTTPDNYDNWKYIKIEIDWKQHRVSMRSLTTDTTNRVDCRQSFWRKQRETAQANLDQILHESRRVQESIEAAAYCLAEHERYTQKVKEAREKAREARANPKKEWVEWREIKDPMTGGYHIQEVTCHWQPNADEILEEVAANHQSCADKIMKLYLHSFDELEALAPPKRRADFRRHAIAKIEKLARNNNWVEQYKARFGAE